MTTTPTFILNGTMLTGREAKKAWKDQSVTCACGSHGDAADSVAGTAHGCEAEWVGCTNCTGQALGKPLVYRTVSQIKAHKAEAAK